MMMMTVEYSCINVHIHLNINTGQGIQPFSNYHRHVLEGRRYRENFADADISTDNVR